MIDQGASPYSPPKANLDSGATQVGTLMTATAGSRLAAISLDALLMSPAAIGAFFLAGLITATPSQASSPGTGAILLSAVTTLYFLAVAVYQVVMLSTRGQTFGKRAMKIRIVKLDGSRPGFLHAFLLRMIVNGLPSAIPYAGRLYPLIDILFIFRADRRCIHDLIAGTRVVRAEAPPVGVAIPGS